MARPRKSADQKLVSVSTNLRPARYDELDRIAKARRIPLSELIRERLDPPVSQLQKHKSVSPP